MKPGEFKASKGERALRSELASIYTPGTPIKDPKLFSGREQLLADLRNQLDIQGKILILYGDRGVGKTSFCNVLLHGMKFIRYSCTTDDNFLTIFLNILKDLGLHLTDAERSQALESGYEIGFEGTIKVAQKGVAGRKFEPLERERLDQAAVLRRVALVQGRVKAIVFDEAQNLQDKKIHSQISTLLKMFSDNHINIKVLFVGIANSDEKLLPRDPSYVDYKLRHYTTACIPPMSQDEIRDIIERRKNFFKISFDEQVKDNIAAVSRGYPSIAHTVALYCSFAWLAENAAALFKNWLGTVPLFGEWLVSKGLKVRNIDVHIKHREFVQGLSTFSTEFAHNYPSEARQLISAFTSEEEGDQRVLTLLSEERRHTASVGELVMELEVDEAMLRKRLTKHLDKVLASDDLERWSLKFPPMGAVVHALTFLRNEAPEEFAKVEASITV